MTTLDALLKQIREEQPIYTPEYFSSLSDKGLYDFLQVNKQYHYSSYASDMLINLSSFISNDILEIFPEFDTPYDPRDDFSIEFKDLNTTSTEAVVYWSYDSTLNFLNVVYNSFGAENPVLQVPSICFNYLTKSCSISDGVLSSNKEEETVKLLDLVFSYCVYSIATVEFGYRAWRLGINIFDFEKIIEKD